MSETFKSINKSLEDIKEKVGLLVNNTELVDNINSLKKENDKLRSHLKKEQTIPPKTSIPNLSTYVLEKGQLPLEAINKICDNAINRNKALLEYKENLVKEYNQLKTLVPNLSIKEYIIKCVGALLAQSKVTTYQKCYDNLNKELKAILLEKNLPEKQQEQLTIFKKGYLLYDLIRTKNEDEFRRMLTDESTKYSESRYEPLIGGANSTLLQVIGLTKIIAILSYFSEIYNSMYNIITSTDKDIPSMQLQEYKKYVSDGKDSQGVNIFYLLNDEQEPKITGELTAEKCLQIYKNGEIINAIVSFFYREPIIPPQP